MCEYPNDHANDKLKTILSELFFYSKDDILDLIEEFIGYDENGKLIIDCDALYEKIY